MSAPQHTPGPWFVSDKGVMSIVASEDSPTICEITCLYDRVDDTAEVLANACLIAAAPDLFAFVECAAKQNPIFAKGVEKEIIREALALVAKATGQ